MAPRYDWVPTGGLPAAFLVGFAVAGAVGGAAILLGVLGAADPVMAIVTLSISVGFAGNVLAAATKRVGVNDVEVRVERYTGAVTFPWAALWPTKRRPSGRWCTLKADPGDGTRTFIFWATRDQARALLERRESPVDRFSEAFLDWTRERPQDGAAKRATE